MKKTGGTICIIMLLCAGLTITPAMGGILKADFTKETTMHCYLAELEEQVTIDFFDCTGATPVKKEIKLSKSEWNALRNELREIRKSSKSIEESLNAQFEVFKEYNLISDDVIYEDLMNRILEKSKNVRIPRISKAAPIINNSIFNVMCAIDFELKNGTTGVVGLNTFVNWIGFDIISVHKGYAQNGIDTKGLISRTTTPGEYIGFMFGFLGFWFGDKTIPAFYSNVTVAGFTVLTAWLPIPLFP